MAKILKSFPRNWGGVFCLNLLGVANTMDRMQWFTVEVGS
jgi:hypothetical protein